MKNLFIALIVALTLPTLGFSQLVGNRLQVGDIYTFESESGPGMFISYGDQAGRASYNGANRQFQVVAPLNGREGFVSLKAVDLPGNIYLVMGAPCPRPYTGSFYYDVNPNNGSADFNENASFEVMAGKSDGSNPGLVSFRVDGGTHFVKRERGVVMAQSGAGVAPRYQNHFTFKIKPAAPSTLGTGKELKTGQKLISANGQYMLIMQTDGNLCIYRYANGKQGAFVWRSMAYGFQNAKLVMQTDGNLCVYDGNNTFKWGSYQTKKYALGSGYTMKLTDNGKLQIMNGSGTVLWTNP